MTQLELADFAASTPLPADIGGKAQGLFAALESIAASTLLEFESPLRWGQWCRRQAAAACRRMAERRTASRRRAVHMRPLPRLLAFTDDRVAALQNVYLAPDDRHMTIDGSGRIYLTDDPPENASRPSVSVLFRSVAQRYG